MLNLYCSSVLWHKRNIFFYRIVKNVTNKTVNCSSLTETCFRKSLCLCGVKPERHKIKQQVQMINITLRLLPIPVGLLVLPCTRQCRQSPLTPSPLFSMSWTEEPAKAGTCARDRRALQQLALNVHVKHWPDLTWPDLTWPDLTWPDDQQAVWRNKYMFYVLLFF